MKKSESKYFNTAFQDGSGFSGTVGGKKDMEYITVKRKSVRAAGVNRSTFYLHYETIGDLMTESIQYMNEQFLEHMKLRARDVRFKIQECPLDELYLVTPEYLTPYLEYIAQKQTFVPNSVKKILNLLNWTKLTAG